MFLIILIVSLLTLLLIGTPIFVALGGASFLSVAIATSIPPIVFVQRMFAGMDKFSLLAVPFFIFAANIMDAGGMAKRIMNLANTIVGGFKSGLALTTILSCMFFGSMSGSAPATVVAIGSLTFPSLKKANYNLDFAAGLITSTASVALLIPPSITMIVYCTATGTSVGKLFMAGVGAGMLYGLMFMLYSIFYNRKLKINENSIQKLTLRKILWAIKDSFFSLLVPVIIIGGIYGGIFTPTEAAAISVTYSIIVSMFIYKELDFKKLLKCTLESAESTAMVMIMVAGAATLSWVLTVVGIPKYLETSIFTITESKIIILIIFNIIMLIAGMFMDGTSFILILAPLFYPIGLKLGIDPVHLGIIMVINGAIGMFTPPFGINLFVATGVLEISYSKIVKATYPFIIISILTLVLITYIPSISLFLANLTYR